ncbi:MAG: SDR family oxidoreductase [Actinobacteria bacterium]|nr:SDR family oxidoreductase [Actinomycetota bacterium]MBV9254868.1 SDR family oxidoreductase [Actinomycetota bacterium]
MSAQRPNALVTGGASGIGAATARRLAADGMHVVVADLDEVGAKDVASEFGGDAVQLDVCDADAVREVFGAVGPVDVLVNNAGADRFAFFVHTDERDWDAVLDVNLRGVIACTHAVLPGMLERGRGVIVNVASEAGRVGAIAGAVYSAAKAGVIGFTKAIAREGARQGVRCNAVAPGPIETPLLNGAVADSGAMGARLKQGMIDATAMGRSGLAGEVAGAIAFLASDDATYITGHTVPVSGGLSMW